MLNTDFNLESADDFYEALIDAHRDLSAAQSHELNAKLVSGVDDELAGTDPAELVARRDAVLTSLLAAKARTGL